MGIEVDRTAVRIDSFFETPQLIKYPAKIVERIRIVGRDANRLLIVHQGVLIAIEAASCVSAIKPRFGVARVSVRRFYQERDRFLKVAA